MLLLKLQSYAARSRIICMRVRPVPLGLTRTAAHPGDIDARHGLGVGGMHMYRRRETSPIKHNPACWSCAWPYSHPTSLVPAPAGCAVVLLRARVHTCQLQTSPCMSRRGRHTRLNSLFNLQDYTLVCVPSSRLRFLCADFTFYVFEVF